MKPMLAHNYDECRHCVEFPGYLQPKVDGVRMLWDGKAWHSRSGKQRLSLPKRIADDLHTRFFDVPLDGELYSFQASFEQISGDVRKWESVDQSSIVYVVFDLPIANVPFRRRLAWARRMSWTKNVFFIETEVIASHKEIDRKLEDSVSRGYEGVMVRNAGAEYRPRRTTDLLKYKPVREAVGTVIGLEEGRNRLAGMLGAFVVQGMNPQTGQTWRCRVGSGLWDEDRRDYWRRQDELVGSKIRIRYKERTPKSIREPVFVEICDTEFLRDREVAVMIDNLGKGRL